MREVNFCIKPVAAFSTFLLVLLLTACSKKDDYVVPLAKGVEVKINSTFGKIITDGLGKTLYFFSNDFDVTSNCEGACIDAWPVFYINNATIGDGLNQSDFGEITRTDGSKQTTYKGWPLYYYVGDVQPDDLRGDKVGDVWYVAKPDYSVMVANNPAGLGKYLVAPKGKTLYTFGSDTNGISNCTGDCISNWPAFLITNVNGAVPSILSESDLDIITRTGESAQQSTYKGKPLYYYSQDLVRGDATGQGLDNGAWLIVDESRF